MTTLVVWWRSIRIAAMISMKRLLGIEGGTLLPWYVVAIGFILFPSRMLWRIGNSYPVKYDPMSDTFEIHGVRYSVDLFREFGIGGMPKGTLFQIVERRDGALTVRRITRGWRGGDCSPPF